MRSKRKSAKPPSKKNKSSRSFIVKITALVRQEKRPNRVNVFVDDSFGFAMNLTQIADEGLHKGQIITEAQLAGYHQAADDYLLNDRVEAWALRRHHSLKEIQRYLKRILKTEKARQEALEYLSDHGYVDDQRFAEFWVEYRRRRFSSNLIIRAELSSRGVDSQIIDRLIANADEVTAIREIIAKKAHLPQYSTKRKLMAYLARKGFSYSDIKRALDGDNNGS